MRKDENIAKDTLDRMKFGVYQNVSTTLSSDEQSKILALIEQNKRLREAIELIKSKTLDIKGDGDKDTRPFEIYGLASDALEGGE